SPYGATIGTATGRRTAGGQGGRRYEHGITAAAIASPADNAGDLAGSSPAPAAVSPQQRHPADAPPLRQAFSVPR
ncbi:MAG: hypothetical protein ACTHMA_14235, partial [Thermomicrobiales bacterium]